MSELTRLVWMQRGVRLRNEFPLAAAAEGVLRGGPLADTQHKPAGALDKFHVPCVEVAFVCP